jgi:hypothetical protein
MHSAIRTDKRKQRRDKPHEETQSFTLVTTSVQEKRPDFFVAAFRRRPDRNDNYEHDEQRDVKEKNHSLDLRQELEEEGIEKQRHKN